MQDTIKKFMKNKKKLHICLRGIIQLIYFLLIPSAYTAAFAGVKYLFTQIGAVEKIQWNSFLAILIVLCVYTIIFGRFFCGFACTFGSFGDALHWIYQKTCKKLKKKPIKISEKITGLLIYLKYIVLVAILILCYLGLYGNLQGSSPWDVFSMIHAGNLKLGAYTVGVVVLILLILGMCIQERFFCRFFCPMGAVFSILPVLPFFSLHRDREECLRGCKGCEKKCPVDVKLPNSGTMEVRGECIQCQKCIDTCPKSNVHCGVSKVRGNEFLFTIIRAMLLAGLLIWAGI
ncbi:MAG: 4Fe-4S binding protein [Lachnospiraceae bacterium]|nr:4Fe-4S binding protein [Lachnospiraceae bacterium]MDD3614853.1 4Fe-4S binding protein [Lachnospiraceae bacterium]